MINVPADIAGQSKHAADRLDGRNEHPVCAQWCIFSIVRSNFEKYDLCSAPIARAPPRYIVPFFKFFKT